MNERGRFLGKIEIRYYGRTGEQSEGTPSVPPGVGHVDIAWESVDPGATEARLKGWALNELTGEVNRIFGPPQKAISTEDPSTFAWPDVFRFGDVVRRRDGRIGVILGLVDSSPDETPRYELHVDTAADGVRVGVECWAPWSAILANDPDSIARAGELGLRGLPGFPE